MISRLVGVGVIAASALGAMTGCTAAIGEENDTQSITQAVSAVKEGERNFDTALATGNGRACVTCHIEKDAFALKPAAVEARYQALPRDSSGKVIIAGDPLFRSIDADDFDRNFTRLRQGLVRVTITLAANITVDELPGARTINLFRAVPTIANVAFTGPYLSDRRATTLQEQALGAAVGHIQPQQAPNSHFLDTVAAYELDQFSSKRVEKLAKDLAKGKEVTRAEPDDLTAEEQQGRDAFNFRCSQCHGGPELNNGVIPTFVSRTLAVSVSRLNRTQLPVYTFRFHMPDGSEVVQTSPDPGRALLTGDPSPVTSFETFDVPTLYGVKDTAPYFHDNSIATLEAIMQHYQEDFAFAKLIGIPDPAVQTPMSADEMRLIPLYLKKL